MKLAPVLVLAFGLALLSCRCLAQDKFDIESAQKLFEARCSPCHPLDRTLKKLKNKDGWQKTVERMRSYVPAQISGDEVRIIAEYLSRVRNSGP